MVTNDEGHVSAAIEALERFQQQTTKPVICENKDEVLPIGKRGVTRFKRTSLRNHCRSPF